MSKISLHRIEANRRLRRKTQDQQFKNAIIQGANISPFVAEAVVQEVHRAYFSAPEDRPMRSGQILYTCISSYEGAEKTLDDGQMSQVTLTLLDKMDLILQARESSTALRQARIIRLTKEAKEQWTLLTQEDLAYLLMSNPRTIRHDIHNLRQEKGISVPTRGQQKDIGPGVTHRELVLRYWFQGMEPVEIIRQTSHSLESVESYIQRFSHVVYMHRIHWKPFEIAMILGITASHVQNHLRIYESYKGKPEFQYRLCEIDLIGGKHFREEEEKKGACLPSPRPSDQGRRS